MKIKVRTIIFWFLIVAIYLLSSIIQGACDWFNMRFGVSFEEILFTLTSPLAGSDISFLEEAFHYVLPYTYAKLPILLIGIAMVIILKRVSVKISLQICKKEITFQFYTLYKCLCTIMVLSLMVSPIQYAITSLDLETYVSRRIQKSKIYEEYYVDPATATITHEGEFKNLIYIYIESMETTYASIEDGGAQDINYIPKLTQLAKENVSFSDTDKLGGAYVTTGAGWTMGALFSTTTGVPFSFPIEGNSMNRFENFAPGITSLGDILNNYGYKQVFLCGSDGSFAGRKAYFEQHGSYEVRDLFYAKEKDYIPQDYLVWWGYEDLKLYDIAKKELMELAECEEPFNCTMLTVDTHHVDGYICCACQNTYEHQLGNVLECADNQIAEFIAWCQEQDFYEDTVIVISGDHFRMDSSLVAGHTRRLYNCFINAECELAGNVSNRVFTSLDLFPTTLSALGFEISGERLGLGTNLFSTEPTLAEKLGYDTFDTELGKYSDFFVKNFE